MAPAFQSAASSRGRVGTFASLSYLDQLLPLLVAAAMVAGLIAGRLIPGLEDALNRVEIADTVGRVLHRTSQKGGVI